MLVLTSCALAQKKGEMPFTSSAKNANKTLRNAWAALADFKVEEGNKLTEAVLKEDPNCGICYASLFPFESGQLEANIDKAASMTISEDERLLIEGLIARRENRPNDMYFEPLLKKYPKDDYLHLWIILNNTNGERAIQIADNLSKRNSKLGPVYNLLGYLHMNKNEMPKAEEYFNRYIEISPTLANPYDSKGDYLMQAGRIQEALDHYQKAVNLGMSASHEKLATARARLKFPSPSETELTTIRDVLKSAVAAYEEGDIEKYIKYFGEQSIQIFPDQRVNVGRSGIYMLTSRLLKNTKVANNDIELESVGGAGPIAVARGMVTANYKENASGKEFNDKYNAVYILRKNEEKQWYLLATHLYSIGEEQDVKTENDRRAINDLLTSWQNTFKPEEPWTQEHLDRFATWYSPQAVEILPHLVSNVGLPNLQVRWQYFLGSKMMKNALNPIGIEVHGSRAVAWGVGDQKVYPNGSEALQEFQFPWAMILTKENDSVWKILAIHWGE